MESLVRLQGLHADLVAFNHDSQINTDRLLQELQASIDDFRQLLDKPKSSDADARAYNSGTVEVDGQEYAVNEEFRHLSNAIGTALSISEEHAARLYIETQISGDDDETTVIADVVRKYHDRRDYLLQDLRIILSLSLSSDAELSQARETFEDVLKDILDTRHGVIANSSLFARKCLQNMDDIEKWQLKLNDALQSKQYLNQARGEAFYRTLEFQRSSLFKQHEALGAVLALLFRGNHATSEDLRKLHDRSLQWQTLDFACIHYLPAFSAAFCQYGSPNGGPPNDAQALNRTLISPSPDAPNAPYRPLAATLEMWWTAQYSGHYLDNAAPDPNAEKRVSIVKKALDDGSLELMLCICLNMANDPRQELARFELVQLLLEGSNISFDTIERTSPYFVTMMMEAYEHFAEGWITNMPDSIRRLKAEEDDQRLKQITAQIDGTLLRPPREQGARLHLEAFLLVIAYAFQDQPDAAEQYWEDQDSNLYGFIQWASRRQTVPRVSAFCEMLCAISSSSENAESAHKFLLDDVAPSVSTRGRKLPSMNYQQIMIELDFYAKKVHEKSQTSLTMKSRSVSEPELNEAESPIMLCCYLRLLGHLCRHTHLTRNYVLNTPGVDLVQSLLALSSGPIPSFLRAGVFEFLEALLTEKTEAVSDKIWQCVDAWASTNHDRTFLVPEDKQSPPTLTALQNTLTAIASSHDQSDAFVKLLLALVQPVDGPELSFPPELGTMYRAPGITPYTDMVCGQLRPGNMRNWLEDGNVQGVLRSMNIVLFLATCLKAFDEDQSLIMEKSRLSMYAQRNPFARAMQWIFSTDLNKCLVQLLGSFAESVSSAAPEDPKIQVLDSTIALLIQVINSQSTYFDIVKPLVKSLDGYKVIQYSGLTSIEDSVIGRPELLLQLCQFAVSEHLGLALCALQFLEKLSESSRFTNHLFDVTKNDRKGQQMLEMIGTEGELKLANVSARLRDHFAMDTRELEAGADADGYKLKDAVISFFNACLSTQSDGPNLAHILLGVRRVGSKLAAGLDFESGTSVFDALTLLSYGYPDGLESGNWRWLIHIKAETMCVLKHLWSFPISSDLALTQLRRSNYMVQQFSNLSVVVQDTLWDDLRASDGNFYLTSAADAFTDFLFFRTHLYDYVTREIQLVAKQDIKAHQLKYLSTLQGKSIDVDGISINHPTLFNLFDFAELDTQPSVPLGLPQLQYFHQIDLYGYRNELLFDIERVRTALASASASLIEPLVDGRQNIDHDVRRETEIIVALLEAQNRYAIAQAETRSCLRSYVDMVISIVDCCPMDAATKTQFGLRMLQLILPKLDTYLADGAQEAVELTRMADTLLLALSKSKLNARTSQTRVDVSIAQNLFQLFRTCSEGVQQSTTNPDLRAILYSICAQYLNEILLADAAGTDTNKKARENAIDTIRSAGPQLISILSDDADDGVDTCRLNALNFLSQLVSLARSQKSNFVVEAFVKSNTVEVLLDPIKSIADEFSSTDPNNRHHLLEIFEARTLLLLQISRTKAGASALFDASLIQTLRNSFLFAADPDLGFDLHLTDPTALTRSSNGIVGRSALGGAALVSSVSASKFALTTYFTLLSAALRLLLSTFLSFGPENEKAIFLVRGFLADYRGNMVGVFKRAAGLDLANQQAAQASFLQSSNVSASGADQKMTTLVDECMKAYTGLAIGSGFLEYEDEKGLGGNGIANGVGMGRSGYGGGFT